MERARGTALVGEKTIMETEDSRMLRTLCITLLALVGIGTIGGLSCETHRQQQIQECIKANRAPAECVQALRSTW